jgi:hypothetical protein
MGGSDQIDHRLAARAKGPEEMPSAAFDASAQRKIVVQRRPYYRLGLFAGCGHGVDLLQPERCADTALGLWRQTEGARR